MLHNCIVCNYATLAVIGGDSMDAYSALREAASRADVPLRQIGRAMDKPDNYVNSAMSRGSVPRCDTMAKMAEVCGHELALVPSDDMPESALRIDG